MKELETLLIKFVKKLVYPIVPMVFILPTKPKAIYTHPDTQVELSSNICHFYHISIFCSLLSVPLCHFCLCYCLQKTFFSANSLWILLSVRGFLLSSVLFLLCCHLKQKGKDEAFDVQWLCIWCQNGSFLMTVQAVIRVCPYKEQMPLMGFLQINYRKIHTFSVVLKWLSNWPRCVWGGLCGLPHSGTADSTAFSWGCDGSLWWLSCHVSNCFCLIGT